MDIFNVLDSLRADPDDDIAGVESCLRRIALRLDLLDQDPLSIRSPEILTKLPVQILQTETV